MTERAQTEVKMRSTNPVVSSTAYTTGGDFCRIFSENMKDLYLLGWLLTGDAEKAEQCFVSGLGDCIKGNAVFKEWAQSWARRTVIQNAIQIMSPVENETGIQQAIPVRVDLLVTRADIQSELEAIVKLQPLERFVFVMSVLEGYSYQDCSILLGCSRQQIVSARERALEHLANGAESSMVSSRDARFAAAPLSN